MKAAYQVTLDPGRHELTVAIDIQGLTAGELTLLTPTWVPGDYDFEPFGRDVFDVRAVDPVDGKPVPVRRQGWSGYGLEPRGGAVAITYRASASSVEFSEECGVLGDCNGVYSFEALCGSAAHEKPVVLGVLRGNQPRAYTVEPLTRTSLTGLTWAGSPQQAALISRWLNTPFSPTPGQTFSLAFYENFHGIETVI